MPVGIALLVAGVATFAFFKVGKVALGGDAEFQPISSLWFATFALAPGFFLPLEQELGRALVASQGAARGRPTGRRPRRSARRSPSPCSSLLAILALQPADHRRLLRRQLVDARRPRHRVRRLRPGPPRPRHLLGLRSLQVVRGRDRQRRRRAHPALRRPRRDRHHAARRRTRSPSRCRRWSRSSPSASAASSQTEPGPPAPWNEVTQNLGWLLRRHGLRGGAAQRRPGGRQAAGAPTTEQDAGHAVRVRRAARPHPAVPLPGRAGGAAAAPRAARRRRATSSSSAAASGA